MNDDWILVNKDEKDWYFKIPKQPSENWNEPG